jgi:hypothetical protein
MGPVVRSYGRALAAQFSGKMLLLSVLPLILSVLLWGGLLYLFFQPLLDFVQVQFATHDAFKTSNGVLSMLGLGMLKTMVVPLIAMLLLLPLMILSSLLFMGVIAMPAIARHVGQRQFPQLEKKHGGSLLGSLLVNLSGMAIFIVLWLLSLPLYAVAPLALLVQVALWGWLTARVMSYDALADYASEDERAAIKRLHGRSLMLIGMVSGAAGALPGIAWIGGALLSVVLFPFLAILSIWLYLMIFIFTGLWFEYYCLDALEQLRSRSPAVAAIVPSDR